MKKNTKTLIAALFILGIIVTCTYVYLSYSESKFLRVAIVTWIIVLITVFSAFIFEVYDINVEQ